MDFADILKIHNFNPKDVRLIRHPGNTIYEGINLEKSTFYSINESFLQRGGATSTAPSSWSA